MFEQAKPKFQEAIAYQTTCGDSVGLMLNLRSLGDVYCNLNKIDSALYSYNRALMLSQQDYKNINREIDIRSSLIDLYILEKEYEKAREEFKIFDTLSNHSIKDYILSTKINVHIINKEYSKAIDLTYLLKNS